MRTDTIIEILYVSIIHKEKKTNHFTHMCGIYYLFEKEITDIHGSPFNSVKLAEIRNKRDNVINRIVL